MDIIDLNCNKTSVKKEAGGEDDDIGTTTRTASDSTERMNSQDSLNKNGLSAGWTRMILRIHAPLTKALVAITRRSASNPKITYYGSIGVAIAIFAIGLFTNFSLEVDEIWTPMGSKPLQHKNFIEDRSGFPALPRSFLMSFHERGENILSKQSAQLVFQAVNAVRNLPKYEQVCAAHENGDCEIKGIPRFWNNSLDIFEEQVQSDEDAIAAMSSTTFGDGTRVSANDVFGTPVYDSDGNLTSVLAYWISIDLPDTHQAEDFEEAALDAIFDLEDEWKANPEITLRMEVMAERSFDDEFTRAITSDLVLVPIVFIIMSLFTCAIFVRRNPFQSRAQLGLAAVISVFLSIMTGFGLMFACGVPFTSMTQILPFVLFGIGLDDAFIVSGAYSRTDPNNPDVVGRIQETIEDVGISIALTTITSVLAFGLGCASTIPAVYWLCLYAFVTIAFVFLYQITFFVAALALDEQRIQDQRRDCCRCLSGGSLPQNSEHAQDEQVASAEQHERSESAIDRFMASYARQIMKPWVKAIVIVAFAGLAAICAFSVSKLEQYFDAVDVLPSDSYVTDFFDSQEDYSTRSSEAAAGVYFRFVDQSDPAIQQQMEDFVNDLVEMEAITSQPTNFWLRDFREFVNETTALEADMAFVDQLDSFLNQPLYQKLYGKDIVLDEESGEIIVSRCFIKLDNFNWDDVTGQMEVLKDQRSVARSQPVNQGRDSWAFFTYGGFYDIWQFYMAIQDELTLTSILGVAAVTGVALVFVPHWTAAFFVLPLISVLYIDLLGFMQWFGVNVDAVLYVSLVMSIGLLVDFIMHVLLRYYESSGNRQEKTEEMLKTMGSSILIGAISTFLGTLPLAFSTSEIFFTVFVAFLGLVLLGGSHGLILLPVILSMIGPEEQILLRTKTTETCDNVDASLSGGEDSS